MRDNVVNTTADDASNENVMWRILATISWLYEIKHENNVEAFLRLKFDIMSHLTQSSVAFASYYAEMLAVGW